MPETLNRMRETFIASGGTALREVGGANFAERVIDGAMGPLTLTTRNMGEGAIMLEMRQGAVTLSKHVADEDLGAAGATGIIALDDTLDEAQCVPGTLVITCDADTWTDDGAGALVAGDDNVSTTTSSSIDYMTGAVTLAATGATNDADITGDYDKGWIFAGQAQTTQLVNLIKPRVRVDVYSYGPAADATYLECVVEGDISGGPDATAGIPA